MDVGHISSLMRGSITQILWLIGPVLGAALIIGLVVAIFQATTSIQEQTLTFLPKLLTILAVLALLGGWMFTRLSTYAKFLFEQIPGLAH